MSLRRGAPCLARNRATVFCSYCEFMNNRHVSSFQDIQGTRGGDAEVSVGGSLLAGARGLGG